MVLISCKPGTEQVHPRQLLESVAMQLCPLHLSATCEPAYHVHNEVSTIDQNKVPGT
jgi:hypothetical protein